MITVEQGKLKHRIIHVITGKSRIKRLHCYLLSSSNPIPEICLEERIYLAKFQKQEFSRT